MMIEDFVVFFNTPIVLIFILVCITFWYYDKQIISRLTYERKMSELTPIFQGPSKPVKPIPVEQHCAYCKMKLTGYDRCVNCGAPHAPIQKPVMPANRVVRSAFDVTTHNDNVDSYVTGVKMPPFDQTYA